MAIFIIVGGISKVSKDLLFLNQNASEWGQVLNCEFCEQVEYLHSMCLFLCTNRNIVKIKRNLISNAEIMIQNDNERRIDGLKTKISFING